MSVSAENRHINREYYLRMSKYFQYPTNLFERIYTEQVILEHIFARGMTVYGTIRVNNCSLDKNVLVRYTVDQWKTCSIVKAYYSIHYSDNNTDSFQFKLTIPKDKLLILLIKKTISFVICYCVNGQEFWDNNYSRNYNIEVIERTYKETNSIIDQLSTQESILINDGLQKKIAQDYHAISNPSPQIENICGLKNLGGTCYMNSVLQSLSFTSLLTTYFLSNDYFRDIKMNNILAAKGIIANEYMNLLYLSCCGKYTVITPAPFKQIIGHIQYTYLKNEQQDAHEFLIVLLDYLHKDLNRIKSSEILNENEEIDYYLANPISNDSIIIDLFYGTYKSTTTCLTCMHISDNFEPFICLTLPIPSINQCTLEDCLSHLKEDEDLLNDSQLFCSLCQKFSNAKKRLEIHKLPKILIIQFKRFQLNFEMQWIKNNTHIIYPETNLNLKEYCSSQQSFYTLYSIINHDGSLNDGHYTTFSRDITSKHQQWFECDDEIIKTIDSDKLHSNSKAYLLFYIMN